MSLLTCTRKPLKECPVAACTFTSTRSVGSTEVLLTCTRGDEGERRKGK